MNSLRKGRPVVTGGGNVEDNQFVRFLAVVSRGQDSRIACLSQARELHALNYASAIRVETGDDAPGQAHEMLSRKLRSTCSPVSLDFSG